MNAPNLGDGQSFLLYLPWKTSLYGLDDTPQYWLRVLPYGVTGKTYDRSVRSKNYDGTSVVTDIVTTMDMKQFLLAVTFGSAPHVEVAITDIDEMNGFGDITREPGRFMTQALLRSYESRMDTLIQIARDKKYSMVRNGAATRALIGEMKGTLTLWRQLMNTGSIHPVNCLLATEEQGRYSTSLSQYMPGIEEERADLKLRMFKGNNANLRVLTREERDSILRGYGCA